MHSQITIILREATKDDDHENITHSCVFPWRGHLFTKQEAAVDDQTNGYMGRSSDGDEEPDIDTIERRLGM